MAIQRVNVLGAGISVINLQTALAAIVTRCAPGAKATFV